jgi:DNA-binding NarL/FixJ family response regulator
MPQKNNDLTGEQFAILPMLKQLQAEHKNTKVIILSQYLQQTLVQSIMRCGVKGYLLKSDDLTLQLAEAIEVVNRGGVYFSVEASQVVARPSALEEELTEAQSKALLVITQNPDAPYSVLADEMGISESTFKWHLKKAFQKLGVNNKAAAIVACVQYNLVPFFLNNQNQYDFGAYGVHGTQKETSSRNS